LPHQYFFLLTLAASVIFLVALIRTDFALVILILSMLLSPEFKSGAVSGRAVVIRIDDILLLVVFLGWLAKMAIHKELGLLKTTILNRPILIYLGIGIIATFLGAMQGSVEIKRGAFYLMKYIEYFLLFFMVANNLKSLKQAKFFVSFILLTAFLSCAYAWSQIPSGERLSAPFEQGEGGEPNTFAGYLILMMGLILGLVIHAESVKKRFLLLGLFGFVFVPFLLTLSRGGWLGFFPMFMTFIFLGKKFKPFLVMAFVCAVLLLPRFLPSSVQSRFADTFSPEKTYEVFGKRLAFSESTAARIDSWQLGLQKWMRKPILGYGIPSATLVDNQYTLVLTETGLLGFLAFMWIIIKIFRQGISTYFSTGEDSFSQGLSLGFVAGLAGILIQSFSSANFIIVRIMEPFWFLTAIIVMLPELKQQNNIA